MEIGFGRGEDMKLRMRFIMTSVFKSHFEDVVEKPRVCSAAV